MRLLRDTPSLYSRRMTRAWNRWLETVVDGLSQRAAGKRLVARSVAHWRRQQLVPLTLTLTVTLTVTLTLTLTLTVTLTLTRTLTRALAGMAGATRTPNTCATANAASARWATRAAKGRRRRCAAHSLTQPQPEPEP